MGPQKRIYGNPVQWRKRLILRHFRCITAFSQKRHFRKVLCFGAKSFALQGAKYSDLCLCWSKSIFRPYIFSHPPPLPGPLTPTRADTGVASRLLRSRRGSRRNPKNGALSRRILRRFRSDLPTTFPRLINATLPPRNRRNIRASERFSVVLERTRIGTLERTPLQDSLPFPRRK